MDFYIKEITASGNNKTTSTVTFEPGLNIICGASDTGKSAILKSIKFLMGSSKPFGNKKNGYDTFSLKLQTLQGSVVLTRKVGKNIINVESSIKGIDSNDYDIGYQTKGNSRPVIQSLWLKLLGINNDVQVLYNQDGFRKHLTILRILRAFYLNEDDIDEPGSVLMPIKNPTERMYFLSSLLYLITGNDFSEHAEKDSEKISIAKQNAIKNFAHNRIADLSKQREIIKEQLTAFQNIDVEEELNKLINRLSKVEEALNVALEELSKILNFLTEFQEKAAECSLILNRYKILKSQYESDIKRLTFVAEGEKIRKSTPKTTLCPYCSTPLKEKPNIDYTEAAKKELARIIIQLQGLEKSEEHIAKDLENTNKKIKAYEDKRSEIQKLIRNKLKPEVLDLKNKISKYETYIKLKKEYDLIHDFSKVLEDSAIIETEQKNDESQSATYKPKDNFPENFEIDMANYADAIFTECHYRGFNKAGFDLSKFDILVNGEYKADSHGKGYHSFINTIAGLSLRQYLIDKAKYNPGLFIVDTPLHGFDEGVPESDKKSMKYNLFQYFINHCNSGQTIVIENKRNLPDIDFEAAGVNIIDFTHDNYVSKFKNNRYGFLIDEKN